jgi:hypothetical protein
MAKGARVHHVDLEGRPPRLLVVLHRERRDIRDQNIDTPQRLRTVGDEGLQRRLGGLVANAGTPMPNKPLPERVMKYEVTEQGVRFNNKIRLPFEPFIGTTISSTACPTSTTRRSH